MKEKKLEKKKIKKTKKKRKKNEFFNVMNDLISLLQKTKLSIPFILDPPS